MKTAILLLFALAQCGFGATNLSTIAVSDWSEPGVTTAPGGGSLRVRLLIYEGYSAGYGGKIPETLVYVELENVGLRDLKIYCDFQIGLQCDLRDANNKPPPAVGTGGNGGFPSPSWITLPRDSSTRLRASWFGYGMRKEEGLKIPIFHELILKADNTNQYFLSGTFTVSPPTNSFIPSDLNVWTGTLTLPKMRIPVQRR
jgi:hypothetical protein